MGESRNHPHGTRVAGADPKELVLSDGSRLKLESAPADGRAGWLRLDGGRAARLSARAARELAGDHQDYVEIRTRAEAEWLRTLAQWAAEEASRLDEELADARA